jgi:hypothetical protein
MITAEDLLTTYWPQTIIILATVGYLSKRFFDHTGKKEEIKFEVYYDHKIEVIKEYYKVYGSLDKAVRDARSYFLNTRLTFEFIKNDIWPAMTEIKNITHEMVFFAKKNEIEMFQTITDLFIDEVDIYVDNRTNEINLELLKDMLNKIRAERSNRFSELSSILKRDFGV